MAEYFMPLADVISEFKLEVLHEPKNMHSIRVATADTNRPGLQLAGFFDHFDPNRIQIMGNVETTFMQRMDSAERRAGYDRFFAHRMPAVILARGIEPFPECVAMAERHDVPLLRTGESTSVFESALIASLQVQLAPRISQHGVLVEVYGEGILLMGESGIGKSETAIELLKRGHRLIADDAVEIKRVSAKSLVGTAPEILRYYIELRGVGIIDVRRLFGVSAVKMTEKIELVIQIETWVDGAPYDRLGIEEYKTEILGIEVPSITVPVKPGRNLAVIIEVAAMNNRHKRMGHNAAREFTDKLTEKMERELAERDAAEAAEKEGV
jgi:HPr kinase/phosphorylase